MRRMLALGASLAGLDALAATAEKRRLGVLGLGEEAALRESLLGPALKQLAELGYVEGRNLEVIVRANQGPPIQLRASARELLAANVDALLTQGSPATLALMEASRTIPIVTNVYDPVAAGFARDLRHPGGNVTGLAQGGLEVLAKLMELIRALQPGVTALAIPYSSARRNYRQLIELVAAAAHANGLRTDTRSANPLQVLTTLPPGQTWCAYLAFAVWESDALRDDFLHTAIRLRIATFTTNHDDVNAGTLASFAADMSDAPRRNAMQLAQIFRGANPADMPFEYPTRFHMRINRATAAALKLAIPSDVLLRADEVVG